MGVKLLGKIKIHEIAKELDLTSKEVIEKANSLGIKVSSHLSSIDDEMADKIKESFGKKSSNKVEDRDSKKKDNKKKDDKKNTTPVIIRREVIVTEDNQKEQEKPKTNKGDIGFVERNKNQDYNIVYRNKTTKPTNSTPSLPFGFFNIFNKNCPILCITRNIRVISFFITKPLLLLTLLIWLNFFYSWVKLVIYKVCYKITDHSNYSK